VSRERRQDERYEFEAELEVVPEGEAAFNTATVNLSLGGLCFTAPRLMRTPEVVKLRLALDEEVMLVSAGVRHATQAVAELGSGAGAQFVIGAQFLDLTAVDRKVLKKKLVELAKEHRE
jgi:hypothetical protein